jgi:hypothetical protein
MATAQSSAATDYLDETVGLKAWISPGDAMIIEQL